MAFRDPSGVIVLGGWLGVGEVPEALAEVNERGSLVKRVGHDARTSLPYFRDDSGLTRIAFEADGDPPGPDRGREYGLPRCHRQRLQAGWFARTFVPA